MDSGGYCIRIRVIGADLAHQKTGSGSVNPNRIGLKCFIIVLVGGRGEIDPLSVLTFFISVKVFFSSI